MLKRAINWFERHNKISWIITILIAGFIFYISSLTFSMAFQKTFSIKSYLYHFAVFFIFAFFLLIASIKGSSKIYNKLFFLILIIVLIYAVSDELHQYFVPGRSCSLNDALLDSLGILFAFVFYNYTLKN